MANAIEMTNIEDFLKDCDLVKGAKRIPFEIVEKSLSTNLVFSLGAWNKIVMPFVTYLIQARGDKNCEVRYTDITIAILKTGIETSGKHIDTQVVFFVDREKVVCHFYYTTQLGCPIRMPPS